ncbi:MAG: ATP-binding protein [Prevotellaceae bacterium]|nr:ATP-binding protein [Prevotellaceae bacterium]
MAKRYYPIGMQDFENLRKKGYVYVDKTEYVYNLVTPGRFFFLSRPRRFGKSLLISTLKAYFEGKKELFEGLKIMELEKDWTVRPVFYLNLMMEKFSSIDILNERLDRVLADWEEMYGSHPKETTFSLRFEGLIKRAMEQTGQKVAILVDEYDKPLVDNIDNPTLQDDMRDVLSSFYSVIKGMNGMIDFAMLAGVTKWAKVGVFSGLNSPDDISMQAAYAGVCGITEEELDAFFEDDTAELASQLGKSIAEIKASLKLMYDGYHFSKSKVGVYNPFSLLAAYNSGELNAYWFATGTPTYLVKLLQAGNYNLSNLSGVSVSAEKLGDISTPQSDIVPILYQSGYLTIKGYDSDYESYTLDFPNREVRRGFFNSLLPQYIGAINDNGGTFNIRNFIDDVEAARIDDFFNRLKALLANVPYTQAPAERLEKLLEQQYQNIVYILFTLMGFNTEVEHHTALGRIDFTLKTKDYIYVMEFKTNGTAAEALAQIRESRYADCFANDPRKLFKIGVGFDHATRNLDEWLVEG